MSIRNTSGEPVQLLNTFKAIYEYGSISAAADIRGITQSAASKHLQKLREWFDDELFLRTAHSMEPTAKAISLIDRAEHILQEMALLFEDKAFEPHALSGTLCIATTSEISQKITPHLLPLLEKEAPNLRITLLNLSSDYAIRELESGKVNLVISVNWHAPEQLMQKRLFSDHFVCLMAKSNPLAKKDKLTMASYLKAPHLMVAPLGKERGFIDNLLLKQGVKRKVRLSVPDFLQVDPSLLHTGHLLSLPFQIAESLRKKSAKTLVIKALPFELAQVDYYLFWHRRFQNDSASQWARGIIQEILSERLD